MYENKTIMANIHDRRPLCGAAVLSILAPFGGKVRAFVKRALLRMFTREQLVVFETGMRTRRRIVCAFVAHLVRRYGFVLQANGLIFTFKMKPFTRAYGAVVSVGAVAVCGIVLVSALITDDMIYYEYSYNGKVLGVVKNEAQVFEMVAQPEIKKTIDEKAGADVVIAADDKLAVKKVIKINPGNVPLDTEEDIVSNIARLDDVEVAGYAIRVDGEEVGMVADETAAANVLERVKGHWTEGEAEDKYKAVDFNAEVAVDKTETEKKHLSDPEDLYDRIVEGESVTKHYKVRKKDSAEKIAEAHGLTIERLQALNPKEDLDELKKGDVINVEEKQFPVDVKTVEETIYAEEYTAEPEYIESDALFVGEEQTVTPASVGVRRVTADLVRVNGTLTEKNETAYEILTPSTPAAILRGTKALPPFAGTGTFIRPASGPITSPFGPRWGRMHKGIDIDVNYGPVYAADGGKVVYTGNKGDGYGVKIVIDHGRGKQTLYAHLSKSSVSVGQQVSQGQRIATSGNTGSSTGAHLHFEMLIGGMPKNPLDYL
jgi:murein DD-endopeptidase MepM/ murein hydrolase activator NlpD